MLGHLSHELRGPLGVLLGSLRLLETRASGLSPADQRTVSAALRASMKALEVVDEVSLLARLVEGRQPLVSHTVTVKQLVTEATARGARDQDELPPLRLDLASAGQALVHVDAPGMHTVLRTLIIATARARPDAPVVAIRAELREFGRTPAVAMTIAPDESEANRLTRFEWARGGHGLQLALAAATVLLHGGQLRSRRDGQRDAGVCVVLPLSPSTARADEGRTKPPQPADDARRGPRKNGAARQRMPDAPR